MNFDKMTTDELNSIRPVPENGWEYKDAQYLLPSKKSELLAEIGKQSSAFANTGGGYLLFGVDKATNQLQPCQQMFGKQPMEEWLAAQIQISVERPLNGFNVYRIPFTNDPSETVYLVSYPDSLSAPHQCKSDKKYYWRTNFTSEPAPHFHLELLWGRVTKVILEIVDVTLFSLEAPDLHLIDRNQRLQPRTTKLNLVFQIAVKNTSKHFAHAWGVRFSPSSDMSHWSHPEIGPVTKEGYLQYPPEQLLPGQTANLRLYLNTTVLTQGNSENHNEDIRRWFNSLQLTLVPVSHNHEGNAAHFGCGKPGDWNQGLWENLVIELRKLASLKKDGTLELLQWPVN